MTLMTLYLSLYLNCDISGRYWTVINNTLLCKMLFWSWAWVTIFRPVLFRTLKPYIPKHSEALLCSALLVGKASKKKKEFLVRYKWQNDQASRESFCASPASTIRGHFWCRTTLLVFHVWSSLYFYSISVNEPGRNNITSNNCEMVLCDVMYILPGLPTNKVLYQYLLPDLNSLKHRIKPSNIRFIWGEGEHDID